MKKIKLWLLVLSLGIVLIGLLVIQTQWLVKSATLREHHFEQQVTLALCSAVEELSVNRTVCSALASCSIQNNTGLVELVGIQNGTEIKSIVGRYLEFYNINIPYQVALSQSNRSNSTAGHIRSTIPNVKNAIISINFPTKRDFILSELNGMFAVSFILMGILMVICAVTLNWLFQQRRIQIDTVDFVDAMSHELKTPINNVSMALTMLQKKLPRGGNEKISYYLGIAQSENEALKYKINNVLGESSIESMLEKRTKSLCDVHNLIQKSMERLSVRLEEWGGQIALDLRAEHSKVYGDSTQFFNVFVCLIDNAIIYSAKNPKIEIKTINRGNAVNVLVIDQGMGIPEDQHTLIFEKYYRADAAQSRPGFGIGLYLVRKIVLAHKGEIQLESSLGEGSVFTIVLPLAK